MNKMFKIVIILTLVLGLNTTVFGQDYFETLNEDGTEETTSASSFDKSLTDSNEKDTLNTGHIQLDLDNFASMSEIENMEEKTLNESGYWFFNNQKYKDKGLMGSLVLTVRDAFLYIAFPIASSVGMCCIVISMCSALWYGAGRNYLDETHEAKVLKQTHDELKLRNLFNKEKRDLVFSNDVVGKYGIFKTYILPDVKKFALFGNDADRYYDNLIEVIKCTWYRWMGGVTICALLFSFSLVKFTTAVGGTISYDIIRPMVYSIRDKMEDVKSVFNSNKDTTSLWGDSLDERNKNKVFDECWNVVLEQMKSDGSYDDQQLVDLVKLGLQNHIAQYDYMVDKINLLSSNFTVTARITSTAGNDALDVNIVPNLQRKQALNDELDKQIKESEESSEDTTETEEQNKSQTEDSTSNTTYKDNIVLGDLGYTGESSLLVLEVTMIFDKNDYTIYNQRITTTTDSASSTVSGQSCWKIITKESDESKTYAIKGVDGEKTIEGKTVSVWGIYNLNNKLDLSASEGDNFIKRAALVNIDSIKATYYNEPSFVEKSQTDDINIITKDIDFKVINNVIYFYCETFIPNKVTEDFDGNKLSDDMRLVTQHTINGISIYGLEYYTYKVPIPPSNISALQESGELFWNQDFGNSIGLDELKTPAEYDGSKYKANNYYADLRYSPTDKKSFATKRVTYFMY